MSQHFFESIGLHVPTILLPEKGVDLTKWSVVACDQYTSEPEYWEKAKSIAGDQPSTLNVIYPEVFLEEEEQEKEQRISSINQYMYKYLEQGVLVSEKPGFILVDRKTSHAPSRKGLVVALDLEKYDYSRTSQTLIRATEGTVVERLPPRIKIRENSPIELPHIMVLIDDPEKTVIEPLFNRRLEKVYDVQLMMNSGHVTGYRVQDDESIRAVSDALSQLASPQGFEKKYGVSGKGVLLFAMGDGNHSLATAKAIWEARKKNGKNKANVMSHPARFALVELVNVHDAGLEFEPIHRVVFNVNPDTMFKGMEAFYKKSDSHFSMKSFKTKSEMQTALARTKKEASSKTHFVTYVNAAQQGFLAITNPRLNLEVGTLQSFLDLYLKEERASSIDYIHGEDVVEKIGTKPNNIGFCLPAMSKHDLFKTVIVDGVLPRKTFSMGEADEKRFYLECRKIVE